MRCMRTRGHRPTLLAHTDRHRRQTHTPRHSAQMHRHTRADLQQTRARGRPQACTKCTGTHTPAGMHTCACAPAATHAHMDTREQRQGPRRHGRKPSNSWSQTITTGTGVCLLCSATKPPKVVGSSEVCPGRGPRPGRGRGGRQGTWQKMTSVHQNPSCGGLFVSHQK